MKLDFSQPSGAAHVVALFRAGVGQACDQNLEHCLNVGDKATATKTYTALAPGSYWVVVQSFPGAPGATTVTLSTGKPGTPEVCANGIDDDLDGAIDCADLDCGAATTCNLCVPDINVGTLVVGGAAKTATVDTTTGSNRYHPGARWLLDRQGHRGAIHREGDQRPVHRDLAVLGRPRLRHLPGARARRLL